MLLYSTIYLVQIDFIYVLIQLTNSINKARLSHFFKKKKKVIYKLF